MRRILALAVTLFAALATHAASAGTYTFSVELTTKQVWTNNWNTYDMTDASGSFQFTLTTDSSQRTVQTRPEETWVGGSSYARENTVSSSSTPYTDSLMAAYLSGAPYQQSNFMNAWSYGYYGTSLQFASTLTNANSNANYTAAVAYGGYMPIHLDFTQPGVFDSFLASLVGSSFTFTEAGSNDGGQTVYRGTATLISTTDVPEPHAMLVVGAGMLAAGALRRRRNATSTP